MSLPPIKYRRDEAADDKKARPIVYGIVVLFIIAMFIFFGWLFHDGSKKTSALEFCQKNGGDLTSWSSGSTIALCGFLDDNNATIAQVLAKGGLTVDNKPYDHICGIMYFEDTKLWAWQHWSDNETKIYDKCKLP